MRPEWRLYLVLQRASGRLTIGKELLCSIDCNSPSNKLYDERASCTTFPLTIVKCLAVEAGLVDPSPAGCWGDAAFGRM